MSNSPAVVFDRLTTTVVPTGTRGLFGTVCVLGAGIAGLMAARTLADHADRVVIIEPDGPHSDVRPGVPQGYQVHTLLPGGRAQLERFFPGIVEQAVAKGAVSCGPDRFRGYLDDVLQVSTPNTELVTSSRPFLESLIRRRTVALPNVEVVAGRVMGLNYLAGAVNAVRYTAEAGETVEPADFVVDATGRGSRLSNWLEQGGWPRPDVTRLPVDVRYLTARFRRAEGWSGPHSSIVRYSPAYPSRGLAGAAMNAIEGGLWNIMLAFFAHENERVTVEDFFARCEDLPPHYGQAAGGEPVGDVLPYRHSDSRWRRFDTLPRFPARLAVVGDAVASFNPVYGQGMSSAMLHASCLSEFLRSEPDLDAPAARFLELQRVIVEAAWQTSTAGDAVRLGVAEPPATAAERRRAWATRQVMAAAGQDADLAAAVRAVGFMTAHPSSLLEPGRVARAVQVNNVAEEEFRREYLLPA